jgi:hypothetical protein
MKSRIVAAAGILALAAPAVAESYESSPGPISSVDDARTWLNSQIARKMTYQTIPAIEAAVTPDDQYTGVGYIFISLQSTATSGFGRACTASLIGTKVAVTAAHCLSTTAADPVTGITFILPSARNASGGTAGRQFFEASSFAIHPDFTGDILDGADIAMFQLSTAVGPGISTYSLYTGTNALDNTSYLKVGTGTLGTGTTGTFQTVPGQPAEPEPSDRRKRTGVNLYEFYWADVQAAWYARNGFNIGPVCDANGLDFFGVDCRAFFMFDMDSDVVQNDVFGRFMSKAGLSVMGGDSNSSPGDSGGPTFIDGAIAGITSFGITGGIFQPSFTGAFNARCGFSDTVPGGLVDPSFSRSATTGAPVGCTDSSFGEVSGDTNVARYQDWWSNAARTNRLFTTDGFVLLVPEPGTWAMLIAGFGLVGGALRRRRETVAA